jgi:hypothetical protein
LKIKEMCYLHAEGYSGGALKHGPFALIEGPEGIIAIDTGECVEEMRAALKELRAVTTRPIVAVIYTHFHYVNGTKAIFDEAGHAVPVYAHGWVVANRQRVSDEIGPFYGRGLVEQFGINLPPDGPDGLVHVGLGLAFRFAFRFARCLGIEAVHVRHRVPVRAVLAAHRQLREAGETGQRVCARCQHGGERQARKALQARGVRQVAARARQPRES